MSLIIYHGEPNGPSLTVLAALFESGLSAQLRPLNLNSGARHTNPDFAGTTTAMSVEGEAPIVMSNGEPMCDSVFIGCYFDQVAGGGKLLPRDPYARWETMCWCRQTIERTAPAAAFLGVNKHLTPELSTLTEGAFKALIDPIVSDDLKARWVAARTGSVDPEHLKDSEAKVTLAVERTETQLNGKDWLMGEFSLADFETFSWLYGMADILPTAFTNAPLTKAWLDRVKARPSVQKALALSTIADPRQSWAPGPEINRWG